MPVNCLQTESNERTCCYISEAESGARFHQFYEEASPLYGAVLLYVCDADIFLFKITAIYIIIYMVIFGEFLMTEFSKTMKLHIHPNNETIKLFQEMTECYAQACSYISEYIFCHGFELNFMRLQEELYDEIRAKFGLKAQLTISSFKTVTARYKTVREQLQNKPYKYQNENGKWIYIPRTLEWLMKPVVFSRPQADLVRGRDYSFTDNGTMISVNTLGKRVKVSFDVPECFMEYFEDDTPWSFGTAKLVSLNGEWYLHIPMTKTIPDPINITTPSHVVGIDRGLRFIVTTYDEKGNVEFISGHDIIQKRQAFNQTRAELQSKGTKSAKRALKRISGRENRWMSDVNHQISKTLVNRYGNNTLFVIEDLTYVSFDERNLSRRTAEGRNNLRSWTFYQLEQYLTYKATEAGSYVLKVPADYTSQRCPKCGRIHKENRHHNTHEYICDACGYRSNDDRVGAMNLYTLGTLYVSGDQHPRFGPRKIN